VSSAPSHYIGFGISELINSLGVPRSVYPVRGLEEWQDDVVFVYNEGDFYIYRDRVWQLGVKAAMGINVGDPGGVAQLLLGPGTEVRGNSVFCMLSGCSWPLMFRCDVDEAGKVKAIFIYRTDI
jgi:hypothetical protein